MEKIIFFDPIINDTATFIKTSEDTNERVLFVEIQHY